MLSITIIFSGDHGITVTSPPSIHGSTRSWRNPQSKQQACKETSCHKVTRSSPKRKSSRCRIVKNVIKEQSSTQKCLVEEPQIECEELHVTKEEREDPRKKEEVVRLVQSSEVGKETLRQGTQHRNLECEVVRFFPDIPKDESQDGEDSFQEDCSQVCEGSQLRKEGKKETQGVKVEADFVQIEQTEEQHAELVKSNICQRVVRENQLFPFHQPLNGNLQGGERFSFEIAKVSERKEDGEELDRVIPSVEEPSIEEVHIVDQTPLQETAEESATDMSAECRLCGDTFSSPENLQRHLISHTDGDPFKCGICGNTFSTRRAILIHKVLHSKRKPYLCPICWESFPIPASLRFHMKTIHSPNGSFACNICGKLFMKKELMLKHQALHSVLPLEQKFIHDGKYVKVSRTIPRCISEKQSIHPAGRMSVAEPDVEIKDDQQLSTTCKAKPSQYSVKDSAQGEAVEVNTGIHGSMVQSTKIAPFEDDYIHVRDESLPLKYLSVEYNYSENYDPAAEGVHRVHTKRKNVRRLPKEDLQPVYCRLCGKTFATEAYLRRHAMIHSDEAPFVCEACGKRFKRKEGLERHMVTHNPVEKRHLCEICGSGFMLLPYLSSHMRRVHGLRTKGNGDPNPVLDPNEKPFRCEVCNRGFTRKDICKRHMLIHTGQKPYSCELCEKSFTFNITLKRHMECVHNQTVRPFMCETCGKSFKRNAHLQEHQVRHLSQKPFSCDQCGKTFTRKRQMQTHAKIHISGNTEVIPIICTATVTDIIHADQEPIIVTDDIIILEEEVEDSPQLEVTASMITKITSAITTHEYHLNEKPFKCDSCKRSFKRKDTLARHMVKHDSGRKFMCPLCGRYFALLSKLEHHVDVTHSVGKPHMCDMCGKTYKRKGALKDHQMTHTGERPHVCKQCNKSFTRASQLKNHMLTHMEEMPCHCPICKKGFWQASAVRYHISVTHGGK
ncbi:unnamed protein product [Darwinula stevensoni]|uniref:C2H2-type domain-containing protein n=1 Tax=Darwinula stevensoni TaxID=69355 RepID=A0A7R8WZZ4_9CRUS|nr:unnamed protein product [Darwinula stevensoni]CAG0881135.1 unnamed protein product [Darwinula stevensoni]